MAGEPEVAGGGRRNVLDAIPFSIGYGVETGMLIDIFQRHGLDAMAQVNLDRRDHRNQTTVALGRMAFGILQTFFRRLEQSGTLTSEQIMEQLPRLMHQIKVEGEQYTVHKYEIDEQERPPMITIDEYRKKWDRHE